MPVLHATLVALVAFACTATASGDILAVVQDEFVFVEDILDRYAQLKATFENEGDAQVVFVAMVQATTQFAAQVLDEALGRLDEQLLDWALTDWRFNAWRVAAHLDPADTSWRPAWHAFLLEFQTGLDARDPRLLAAVPVSFDVESIAAAQV